MLGNPADGANMSSQDSVIPASQISVPEIQAMCTAGNICRKEHYSFI